MKCLVRSVSLLLILSFILMPVLPCKGYATGHEESSYQVTHGDFSVSAPSTKNQAEITPGDFDDIPGVNSKDVAYLLWHTLFPNSYPINQNADFTGDGLLNSQDVAYLLWHTLFPETYPLDGTPGTAPELTHSDWYIPGVSVEDVVRYFNEVALDAEYTSGGGNASLVQKWVEPIYYTVEGSYTQQDLDIIQEFAQWVNEVPGFPGMYPAKMISDQNLRICFTTSQGMVNLFGEDFRYADGGVTYWYSNNKIYTSTIGIRQSMTGSQRRSVILEELYNGTGLCQDTVLRTDSIIYQYGDEAQWLSDVDQLLFKILSHPDILPGMNAANCEGIIRKLYY